MDILRRIIALENKLAHLENRYEPKVVHMRPRAPADWRPGSHEHLAAVNHPEDYVSFSQHRAALAAAGSVMVPRDPEDDMA